MRTGQSRQTGKLDKNIIPYFIVSEKREIVKLLFSQWVCKSCKNTVKCEKSSGFQAEFCDVHKCGLQK